MSPPFVPDSEWQEMKAKVEQVSSLVHGRNYQAPAPVRLTLPGSRVSYRVPPNFVGIINVPHKMGTRPASVSQGSAQSLVTVRDTDPSGKDLRNGWTAKSVQLYFDNTTNQHQTVQIILGA